MTKPFQSMRVLVLLLSGLALPAVGQDAAAPVPATRGEAAAATTPINFKPFRRGITETVQLPPGLQTIRRNLVAGKRLRTADLRALADAGDSLAQMRFAKQLGEMNDPSLVSAQAHYYAMAAYNGREGAVPPLLSLLRAHGSSFEASALANIEAALVAQANHGQVDAITGLARFYMDGAPFGAKEPEGLEMMTKVAKAGDHQAALDIALKLIGERQDNARMQQAREFLEIAAGSPKPAVAAMAASLLNSSDEI